MDPATVVIVGLLAVGLGVWFGRRRGAPARRAEQRLHHICLGDRDQVERLVAAELTRAPGITRTEAVERAVARCERDRR